MRNSYPVAPAESRPVYSNVAFRIISYALEEATGGKNYSTLLQELVTGPLGMSNTLVSPPENNDTAVIPPGESTWGSDYGDNVP